MFEGSGWFGKGATAALSRRCWTEAYEAIAECLGDLVRPEQCPPLGDCWVWFVIGGLLGVVVTLCCVCCLGSTIGAGIAAYRWRQRPMTVGAPPPSVEDDEFERDHFGGTLRRRR